MTNHQSASYTTESLTQKLREKAVNQNVINSFLNSYNQHLNSATAHIPWSSITPLSGHDYHYIQNLTPNLHQLGIQNSHKVAILKLNGGLGTTMKCSGPKSALKMGENTTFLDLITEQITIIRNRYRAPFPVIFLNSTATSEPTKAILKNKLDFTELLQNEFPRLTADRHDAFTYPECPEQEWAPPGHGDVLFSLVNSGLAQTLVDQKFRYLFISNADNLGPTFEPKILGFMINKELDFLMETTPKTSADVKGGTLVHIHNKLSLLERAQVAKEDIEKFENSEEMTVFNTNTIWLDLESLLAKSRLDPLISLPVIQNHKVINGKPIIQLETAIGSGISYFDHTAAIVVDRNRFFPVKKTSDLLVVSSDLVQLDPHTKTLIGHPSILQNGYPVINFDDRLSSVDGYQTTFEHVPSLIGLEELTIEGRFIFGENVHLSGKVSLISKKASPTRLEHIHINDDTFIID